jgi:hypothetical protein
LAAHAAEAVELNEHAVGSAVREFKGRSPMSDPDVWREKAAMLRDRPSETDDVDRRRVLLTLAEDCDQMAADLEGDDAVRYG